MKFFNRIKQWFGKKKALMVTTEPITKEETVPVIQKEETPAVQMAATPGITCPECGNRIVVSMTQLISYQNVQCGICGLELSIDKEKSSESIAALTRLEKNLATAARQQRDALL